MKISSINGDLARCEAAGVSCEVNLMLIADQTVTQGDFVLVHTGYAIQKVPAPHAQRCWDAYDAMQVANDIANHSTEFDAPNNGDHHA